MNAKIGLLSDFRVLLVLFVSFRLILLMIHQPIFTMQGVERGVGAGGDFYTYYQIASLSDSAGMSFRDWWSEFPPVWSFMTVAIYQLLGAGVNYTSFAMFLGIIMLAADVGILVLMRAIGTRIHGENTGAGLAWIYSLCIAPVIFLWWTFETLIAFWLLLGLWWLLRGHETRSAVAVAIGTLTKFTPALIFGAVLRFRQLRPALNYIAIALALFLLVYLPLFAQNAAMTLPSLTAQFNKASYQSVWALIDGNYRTGNFGPLEDRIDPARANITQGNPSRIPGIVRLAIAGAIGLFIFIRTRRFDDRGLVAFVTITLLIFFLQAQGWSPQWLVQIIPLVLLCFPNRNGVYVVVLLSLVTFAEYPFLFIRTGDTGGEITGALRMPFIIMVLSRTALLIGICIGLYRILRQEPIKELQNAEVMATN